MDPLSFAYALFNALAAIPKILDFLQKFAAGVMLWYVQKTTTKTLQDIADAAAFSASAQTEGDRNAALDKWRTALSRPRISNSL